MAVKWIHLKAKSGSELALKSCLEELSVSSNKETGCTEYRVFQTNADFYVMEQYVSASALDEHKASEHFIKAKSVFSELVEDKSSQELEEL